MLRTEVKLREPVSKPVEGGRAEGSEGERKKRKNRKSEWRGEREGGSTVSLEPELSLLSTGKEV